MAGVSLGVLPLTAAATAGAGQLVLAALLGIALIILLITVLKLHPFLSLLFWFVCDGLGGGNSAD